MKQKEIMDFIGEFQFTAWITIPTGKTFILWESPVYKNLITNAGRTLFLSRIGSDSNSKVTHIAVGTGANPATLADTTLQTETVRKSASFSTVGSPDWRASFSAILSAAEINNTTEIGLLNASSNGTLATRSTYSAYSVPGTSNVTVNYYVSLVTFSVMTGFTLTGGQTNTYQLSVASAIAVKGVIEADTNNGYIKKTSIATVEATAGSYWHDTANNLLYIHTSNNANPNTHTIYVQAGG